MSLEISKSGPSVVTYPVDALLPPAQAAIVGLQHTLAVFAGIASVPLIVANAIGLSTAQTGYLVSMALLASGLSTLIQVSRLGPVGSGLLSVQGTSFVFVDPLIGAGKMGGLPLMLGMSLALAPVEAFLSRILPKLQKVVTPLVAGIIVLLIGLSLIPVALYNVAAGLGGNAPAGAGLAVAFGVLGVVVLCHAFGGGWGRLISMLAALIGGYVVCAVFGWLQPPSVHGPWLAVPVPFQYGLAFKAEWILPYLLAYIVTTVETVGDLTATSKISGEPVTGPKYWARVQGGVLADSVNSVLAVCCNSFPNTTFAQNNGVIQLTGVAARRAGYWVGFFLCLLGIFPVVGEWMAVMPKPVLGGVTLLLFGFVASAGVKLIAEETLDSRSMLILAVSLACGIGVQSAPQLLEPLPDLLKAVLHSPVTAGGMMALLLNVMLPREA